MDFLDVFDLGRQEAHLPGGQFLAGHHRRPELADFHHHVVGVASHQLDLLADADRPLHDADVDHHALERVEVAVVDQRLEGGVRVARRAGHPVHDGVEDFQHAHAGLGAGFQDVLAVDPDGRLHFRRHGVGTGGRHVNFIQYRNDREIVLDRQVGIGDRLGLHALEGVDQQDRPLARGQAARDLVAEIDVPGGVDQIEFVLFAVFLVVNGHRVHLDCDATLSFQVHAVEQLGAVVALGDRAGLQEKLVGEGAFPVIDVSDDREVANMAWRGHVSRVGSSEVNGSTHEYFSSWGDFGTVRPLTRGFGKRKMGAESSGFREKVHEKCRARFGAFGRDVCVRVCRRRGQNRESES